MGKLAEKYLSDKELWKINNNGLCGFFVEREVMKELMKRITKFNLDIQDILKRNIDKIYIQSWTLHNIMKEGKIEKQRCVDFIDDGEKERRIKIFSTQKPERVSEVFECDYETAGKIAEELNFEEWNNANKTN